MTHAIELNRLSKRFGSQWVLNELSFAVPAGTITALLGESGAGKTTLVRILLGLELPSGGDFQVLGRRQGCREPDVRRQIGYVAERPAFHDWMTVSELGWYTAAFFDDQYQHLYVNWIERFELPARQKVGSLSKGMRTKLALALALAKSPKLLLLDEPTSGLDAMVRRDVLQTLVELAAEGTTILLCSHQIHEVERVADSVAILVRGEIALAERVERLKSLYHDCRLTLRDPSAQPPQLSGEVIDQRRSGRQWQLLMKAEHRADVAPVDPSSDAIESWEIQTPDLERIFIAVAGGSMAASVNSPQDVELETSSPTLFQPSSAGTREGGIWR